MSASDSHCKEVPVGHCFECVTGYTDSGTPSGSEILLDGTIKSYLAKPPTETDKVIMIITDVFGMTLVNIRLIADHIASKGFKVYIPDFHSGESLEPEVWSPVLLGNPDADACTKTWNGARFFVSIPSFCLWLGRHGDAPTIPIVDRAIDAIIALGAKKIGVEGYCWGGRYSALLGASDKVDAVLVAHPSFISVPNDILAIKKPALFICAEHDPTFSKGNVDTTRKILAEKSPDNVVKVYTKVKHGFAVRGDEKDPIVCAARNDVLETSVNFFLKHLV
jgi:dienelactone hydrolase